MRNFIFVILLGFVTTMSAQSYTSRLNNLKDFNTAISKGERYALTKSATSSSSTSEPTIVENNFTCPTCFGRGVALDLGNWRGVTYTTCGTCGGKGVCTTYITVYPTNLNIPVVPSVPQGGYNGGNVGGSSSTNSHIRNTEQEKREVLNRTYGERCRACNGSGKCHACNGTKVAHSFGNTYECKICRNGVCNVCNGTGKTSWNR